MRAQVVRSSSPPPRRAGESLARAGGQGRRRRRAAYGINTGFGALAEVRIAKQDLRELQRNLILSHAAGVGAPLPLPEARALMLLRATCSRRATRAPPRGARARARDARTAACIRSSPSAARSAPRAISRRSRTWRWCSSARARPCFEGQRHAGRRGARARRASQPLVLEAKEGLALINGTQAMARSARSRAARGALADARRRRRRDDARGLLGHATAVQPARSSVRPHPGQKRVRRAPAPAARGQRDRRVARELRKVQDPYSLRCMPQVHGAARDALAFARRVLEREIEQRHRQPAGLRRRTERIVSGGNFHGQPVALALDFAGDRVASSPTSASGASSSWSTRRSRGLPPFLRRRAGPQLGLHDRAGDRAPRWWPRTRSSATRRRSTRSRRRAGREDHVSMGMTAALKARAGGRPRAHVLAIELLAAAQALDFRAAAEGWPRRAGRLRAHPLGGPAHGEGPRAAPRHRGVCAS